MNNDSFLTQGLTFFRQKRLDGGVRTGITLAGRAVLTRFDAGDQDTEDPVLVWLVDLRCLIEPMPADAEEAQRWLLTHEDCICAGFRAFADHLKVGTDDDSLPLEWNLSDVPPGTRMKIVCRAMRRVDNLELSEVLLEIQRDWHKLVESLDIPSRSYS